jgi:hypothetical protein
MSAARILLRAVGILGRGEAITSAALAERMPCCRTSAQKVLMALRKEKLIRIVAWERSGQVWMARYAWGKGHDVAKPRALTRHEKWLAQKNDPAYEQQHKAATARYRERQRAAKRPPPNLLEIVMPTFRMRRGGTGMTTRVHRLSNKEDDEE